MSIRISGSPFIKLFPLSDVEIASADWHVAYFS